MKLFRGTSSNLQLDYYLPVSPTIHCQRSLKRLRALLILFTAGWNFPIISCCMKKQCSFGILKLIVDSTSAELYAELRWLHMNERSFITLKSFASHIVVIVSYHLIRFFQACQKDIMEAATRTRGKFLDSNGPTECPNRLFCKSESISMHFIFQSWAASSNNLCWKWELSSKTLRGPIQKGGVRSEISH